MKPCAMSSQYVHATTGRMRPLLSLLLAAEVFAIAAAALAYPITYSRRITRRNADERTTR